MRDKNHKDLLPRIITSFQNVLQPHGALTSSLPTGRRIEVSEYRLRQMILPMLPYVSVDSSWYLSQYDDVRTAVDAGIFVSAAVHYRTAGYFEDRFPRYVRVDAEWYLDVYADVAEAVSLGRFASAQSHFELFGFSEGRLPHEQWSLLDLIR